MLVPGREYYTQYGHTSVIGKQMFSPIKGLKHCRHGKVALVLVFQRASFHTS